MKTFKSWARSIGSAALSLVLLLNVALAPMVAEARTLHGIATGTVTPPPTSGYTGVVSINGSNLVNGANGAGSVIQLRGANMSGMENFPIQHYTPGGSNMGGVDPTWSVYATWKPNSARLPQNAASFLNLTTYDPAGTTASPAWGATRTANPTGTYLTTLLNNIQAMRSINVYIILDLHWSAPTFTFGGVTHQLTPNGQPPFIDGGIGTTFWTSSTQSLPVWLATNFGSAAFNAAHGYNGGAAGAYYSSAHGGATGVNDFIFEIFNEPYLKGNGGSFSAGSADQAKLVGGTATTWNGCIAAFLNPCALNSGWTLGSYSNIVAGIRANGFSNVLLINGDQYTQELENRSVYWPTDPKPAGFSGTWVAQLACGWHPYPYGTHPYISGQVWGKTGTDSGDGSITTWSQWALAVQAANIPVVITEDGGAGGVGATNSGEPHMAYMQAQADAHGWSYHWWQWNNPQAVTNESNGYISGTTWTVTSNVSGTPGIYDNYGAVNGASYSFQTTSSTSPFSISGSSQTVGSSGSPVLFGGITNNYGTAGTIAAPTPIPGEGVQTYNWMSTHP